MNNLKIIEPKAQSTIVESEKSLNVVAYCRVSTDLHDQRNSLTAQKQFFDYFFQQHTNWNNCNIYADEGISGTSLKKRDAFNKMISDALSLLHPIDLIVTKDVSRFSRNVLDFLDIIEKLRNNKVYVYFITQDISTESNDYRKLLGEHILRAEQESLATSTRVRFGQQLRMSQGVVFGNKNMYGYKIVKDNMGKQHFEIIENEATTVKKIFEWYNEGIGTHRIAKKLEKQGIESKYKNGWSNTVILRILKQEKYVGDLCIGKTFTPDALKHNKKKNNGESKMFVITDHHPEQAIITRELWDSVQKKLAENAPSDEMKRKHNNRYWLSGKIRCGICNERFIRLTKKQKNGNLYVAWDCIQHQHRGNRKKLTTDSGLEYEVGCDSKQVNEFVLRQAVLDIINEIIIPQKEEIIKYTIDYITQSQRSVPSKNIDTDALKKELNIINEQQEKLLDLYLSDNILSKEQFTAKSAELKKREYETAEKLKNGNNEAVKKIELESNIKKYSDAIKEVFDSCANPDNSSEYQEELLERFTKQIIVHPNKILEVYLTVIPFPIFIQYKSSGRGKNYSVEFTIINELSKQANSDNSSK